ncbi:hypothetical protein [Bacillus sp. 165]|uniref:hypothetical protein n=1 Tax=Bacillus sp. 165 TaxID=1529117 RepID=UPI001ADACA23|nr:hypothetical protein [Bacillus sp. 165]MBO9129074.1 hypothetical protein [Bacillus sp. 165]
MEIKGIKGIKQMLMGIAVILSGIASENQLFSGILLILGIISCVVGLRTEE